MSTNNIYFHEEMRKNDLNIHLSGAMNDDDLVFYIPFNII